MSQPIPSFTDPEVLADPHIAFDAMRAEGPAYRNDELRMVVVTRYDEVLAVLRDPETFSTKGALKTGGGKKQSAVGEVLARGFPYTDVLMNTEGDRHAHHAGLVKGYLSAARVRALTAPIQAMVDELLDKLPIGETFEFVSEVSLPLTIGVLCEFTGVPHEHRGLVEQATDAEVSLLGALQSEEQNVANAELIVAMQHLLADLIEQRRNAPQEDLISHVVHTPPPAGREPLTLAEMVTLLRGVVLGGNETTRGLINSATWTLAGAPELLARVRTDAAAFDRFIEEALRATSPVLMLFRVATRDTEIGGVPVAKGETVGVSYGAANRDPAQFPCPHAWDIDRPDVRRHMAFGFGEHFCVGAPLARLESRLALRSIVDRFSRIEVAPDGAPRFCPSFMVRNMASLPLRVRP
ncbi:MAG TPA: cytochrome P450 [Acidimicrobiia bacterium]|nr:cytochrome P450 [Acidimicrobiia bacterium]